MCPSERICSTARARSDSSLAVSGNPVKETLTAGLRPRSVANVAKGLLCQSRFTPNNAPSAGTSPARGITWQAGSVRAASWFCFWDRPLAKLTPATPRTIRPMTEGRTKALRSSARFCRRSSRSSTGCSPTTNTQPFPGLRLRSHPKDCNPMRHRGNACFSPGPVP
uniref:Uncharacterized protein n=1 Tax=Paenarthrobacter nicotinovorans TaxID=29320 RepID=Q8GAM1_PAENI|nr:hypothetical protein [Paenarthrobacter nicotinovorans]